MARKKDINWDLPNENHWEACNLAVLMDLRDELKILNALLHCKNFTDIPFVLKDIAKNTAKNKRKKKI